MLNEEKMYLSLNNSLVLPQIARTHGNLQLCKMLGYNLFLYGHYFFLLGVLELRCSEMFSPTSEAGAVTKEIDSKLSKPRVMVCAGRHVQMCHIPMLCLPLFRCNDSYTLYLYINMIRSPI